MMKLRRVLTRAVSVGMVGAMAFATPAYARTTDSLAGIASLFHQQSAASQGISGVAVIDYKNEAYLNARNVMADRKNKYQMTEEEKADQVALASSIDAEAAEKEETSPYDNVAIAQVKSNVNIRTAPDEEADLAGKIYNNSAATIVDTVEGSDGCTWYEIQSGSVDGYVKADYFVTGDEAEAIAYEVGRVKATVSTETLRLRSEASTESSTVTLLSADEKYDVVSQDGGFARIQIDEDMSGYVDSDYVTLTVDFDKAVSIEEIREAEAAEKAAEEAAAAAEAEAEAEAEEEDSEDEEEEYDEDSEEEYDEDSEDEDSEDSEDEEEYDEDSEDEEEYDEDSEDEEEYDEDSEDEDEDSEDEEEYDEDSEDEDEDSEDEEEYDEDSEDEDSEDEEEYDEDSEDEDSDSEDEEDVEEEEEEEEDSSVSSDREAIVDYALSFVGEVPYVWGGTSLSSGVDCSGFVQQVFKHFGISLPRTSADQGCSGYSVSSSEMQPGDIVYYGGHIAIYIGDGQVVHASNERTGIKVSTWNYRSYISIRDVVD